MAVSSEKFTTGEQAAVTNGKLKITFDTPSDFADWVADLPGDILAGLQWVRP